MLNLRSVRMSIVNVYYYIVNLKTQLLIYYAFKLVILLRRCMIFETLACTVENEGTVYGFVSTYNI